MYTHLLGRRDRLRESLYSRLAEVGKESRKYRADADLTKMQIRSLEQQLRYVQRQSQLQARTSSYKYSTNFSSTGGDVVSAMFGKDENVEKTKTVEMLESLLSDLDMKNK